MVPPVVFEAGYAVHRERIARGDATARLLTDAPPRRPLRDALASALVGVAHRRAPSLDRRTLVEAGGRGPQDRAGWRGCCCPSR